MNRYGWLPDAQDERDHIYAAVLPPAAIPAKMDLRPFCPPVYDQGQLGSCTGNAIAGAVQFDRMRQQLAPTDIVPSRLFIYYNERVMEHTVNQDAGAQIRDGIKTVAKQGACGEDLWPYDVTKFELQPAPICYTFAQSHEAVDYQRVPAAIANIRACLAAGNPVVFGFTVYASFESAAVAASGRAPLPKKGEAVLGGHAVLAVGYDDARKVLFVRNSWGASWGLQGYFTLPYGYVTRNLASDFWTIRLMK